MDPNLSWKWWQEEFVVVGGHRGPTDFLDSWEKSRNEILVPEIEALKGCQQSPKHHPEGDVYTHTAMAMDAAAKLRTGNREAHDEPLMAATLCHDFGKPLTAACDNGQWSHHGHDVAGVEPSRHFLGRIGAPEGLIAKVAVLVRYHLAPHQVQPDAKDEAFRRIIRALKAVDTSIEVLIDVAKADSFGRTTEDAKLRRDPKIDAFAVRCREVLDKDAMAAPIVQGRHLIARGMSPGKEFGELLKKCYEVQEQQGLTDPEAILKVALSS